MKTNTTEPLTLLSHGSLEALYSEAGPDSLCTGHFLAWLTKVTGGSVTSPRLHKGVGFLGYISLPGLPGFWLSSHRAPAVHTEQHQGKSLVMEARAVTWKPSGCLEGDTFCILIASNHLLASRCCFSNRGCCTTSTFSCSPKPQKPRGEALRTHVTEVTEDCLVILSGASVRGGTEASASQRKSLTSRICHARRPTPISNVLKSSDQRSVFRGSPTVLQETSDGHSPLPPLQWPQVPFCSKMKDPLAWPNMNG